MEYKYVRDFLVKDEYCDKFGNILLSQLQNALVETATAQCKQYGVGIDDLMKNGLTWVISKIRIVFNKLPKSGDLLQIATWPVESGHLVFDRDFEVLRGGESIAKASSRWCVIDINTRKPVQKGNIFSFEDNAIQSLQLAEPFSKSVDNFDLICESEHYVNKSEIDVNNHLNNTRYFDIAQSALAEILPDFSRVSEVFVRFRREAVLNEKIGLLVGKNGNTFVVLGVKSENVDIFLFNAKFDI